MTSAQLEHPTRPVERRARTRRYRSTVPASRPRREGMVSEAVVSGYIRELAEHGRRVHGVAERPQVAAQ